MCKDDSRCLVDGDIVSEYDEPTQVDEKHRGCGLRIWYLPEGADCNPHGDDVLVCTICKELVRSL